MFLGMYFAETEELQIAQRNDIHNVWTAESKRLVIFKFLYRTIASGKAWDDVPNREVGSLESAACLKSSK